MIGLIADWFLAAVTVFYGVILSRRAWRMGIIGMWNPIPCPPPYKQLELDRVKCCEHNPCPDRPVPTREFVERPWRCPQCKGWWVTEPTKQRWSNRNWDWKKVSEQVGDKWIMSLE